MTQEISLSLKLRVMLNPNDTDLELVAPSLRDLPIDQHLLDEWDRGPHESPHAELAAPR